MMRAELGKALIGAAAVSTLVVPIGVDGVFLAKAHMANQLWLPHAKLHCAMSFFAAIALGLAALHTLRRAPASDRGAMANAAFCCTAFGAGLIAAGFWPGASYDMVGDPDNYVAPPMFAGLPMNLNIVWAAVTFALGWIGFALSGAFTAGQR